MTPTPSAKPDFPFSSRPEDCALLNERFRVLRPGNPRFIELFWDDSVKEALLRVLAPDWEGLASPKGAAFHTALVSQCCSAFIARRGPSPIDPEAMAALAGAIGLLAERPGALQKLINKLAPIAQEALGFCGSRGCPDAMAELFVAIARSGGPEARLRVAKSLLPAWQLNCDPSKIRALGGFARVYSELFSLGAELNDIFGFKPAPDASIAERLSRALDGMPDGELKSLFRAEFERRSLRPEPPLSEADGWDAKGLPEPQLRAFLSVIAALEGAHPGRGADEALSWLLSHPSLAAPAAAPDRAALDSPKAAPGKARL